MKLLFLTRTFPPVTGGMENQNYDLSVWLPRVGIDTTTIANRWGKKALPLFFPYVLFRALFAVRRHDIVLLGDGVMAAVGWAIKFFFPQKPVIAILHGLDIRYPLPLYQKLWIKIFLPKLDAYITVGGDTTKEAVSHGLSAQKCIYIPNGIDTDAFRDLSTTKEGVGKELGVDLTRRRIVLSVGRLAPHKGIDWFVAYILPKLAEDVLFIVAGDGPKMAEILSIVHRKGLESRVLLLGKVGDKLRNALYNIADVYVKPNIATPGFMEGFGLVSVEAASCGLTVVAADIEGNRYAIVDGENGFLVPSGDVQRWVEKMLFVLSDNFDRTAFGNRARAYVVAHFSWRKIAKEYKRVLKSFVYNKSLT